jgi:hypothetical protein
MSKAAVQELKRALEAIDQRVIDEAVKKRCAAVTAPLEHRIAELEKALEWYASPRTWNQYCPESFADRAREALEREKPLLAAAPELYEALNALVEDLRKVGYKFKRKAGVSALAALEKAEGRAAAPEAEP